MRKESTRLRWKATCDLRFDSLEDRVLPALNLLDGLLPTTLAQAPAIVATLDTSVSAVATNLVADLAVNLNSASALEVNVPASRASSVAVDHASSNSAVARAAAVVEASPLVASDLAVTAKVEPGNVEVATARGSSKLADTTLVSDLVSVVDTLTDSRGKGEGSSKATKESTTADASVAIAMVGISVDVKPSAGSAAAQALAQKQLLQSEKGTTSKVNQGQTTRAIADKDNASAASGTEKQAASDVLTSAKVARGIVQAVADDGSGNAKPAPTTGEASAAASSNESATTASAGGRVSNTASGKADASSSTSSAGQRSTAGETHGQPELSRRTETVLNQAVLSNGKGIEEQNLPPMAVNSPRQIEVNSPSTPMDYGAEFLPWDRPAWASARAGVTISAVPVDDAEEALPLDPQGDSQIADIASFRAGALAQDLRQFLDQLNGFGEDFSSILSDTALSPWLLASLAVGGLTGEIARRQLRRSLKGEDIAEEADAPLAPGLPQGN